MLFCVFSDVPLGYTNYFCERLERGKTSETVPDNAQDFYAISQEAAFWISRKFFGGASFNLVEGVPIAESWQRC